jgi:hypothetical protein
MEVAAEHEGCADGGAWRWISIDSGVGAPTIVVRVWGGGCLTTSRRRGSARRSRWTGSGWWCDGVVVSIDGPLWGKLSFPFVLKTLMQNLNKVNLHNCRSPNSPIAK